MLGSIIPDPLATPVTVAWPTRVLANLGTVSVVMMALATDGKSAVAGIRKAVEVTADPAPSGKASR